MNEHEMKRTAALKEIILISKEMQEYCKFHLRQKVLTSSNNFIVHKRK